MNSNGLLELKITQITKEELTKRIQKSEYSKRIPYNWEDEYKDSVKEISENDLDNNDEHREVIERNY